MSTPADEASAPPGWRGWTWVPSLYYVQGLPYTVVNVVSVPMLKTLGVANAEITFWTSWMGLVWALKALWSPFVDGVSTKRRWVVGTQLAFVPVCLALAFALPLPGFLAWAIAAMFALSILSATHDIAADGFYMLGLSEGQQAGFVGVRSTFWRLALISGEGGLVVLAGVLGDRLGDTQTGWVATMAVTAGIFAVAALYNSLAMPRVASDFQRDPTELGGTFVETVTSFFTKPHIVMALLFILFFRFSENAISGLVSPFLLDPVADGGLGWTLTQVGFVKGTIGVLCLVAGGILGGVAIYANGLRAWLMPMVAMLNLPNAVYWYLAWEQPDGVPLIATLIGVEQFGYGFGFAAYLMFLIHFAKGPYKTSHYAFATGLMALAVWVAKVKSGAVQEDLGYETFFMAACVASIPAFLVAGWAYTTLDPTVGRHDAEEHA